MSKVSKVQVNFDTSFSFAKSDLFFVTFAWFLENMDLDKEAADSIGASLTQLCDELHESTENDDDSPSLSPDSLVDSKFVDYSDADMPILI